MVDGRGPDGLSVAHVAEALGGGLVTMLESVCVGHVRAGIAVTVYYGQRPETSPAVVDRLRRAGAQVHEVPGWGGRSPKTEAQATLALHREFKRGSHDVAVFHSSFAGLVGSLLPVRPQTVFTPHAFASQVSRSAVAARAAAAAETLLCRRSDVVACVSHSEAGVARARGAKNVVVIPNGSDAIDDADWSTPPEWPTEPLVVGAGRLVPQRRPIESAAILGSIGESAATCWIGGAGSGDYALRSGNALKQAGVEVSGWVTPSEVQVILQRATAYLHWTTWDGLPMTVLEALASDAVVVASDIEPNREVLGPRGVFATEAAARAELQRLSQDQSYWLDRALEQRARAADYTALAMQTSWNALVRDLAS